MNSINCQALPTYGKVFALYNPHLSFSLIRGGGHGSESQYTEHTGCR
jgi:hypothetical protein